MKKPKEAIERWRRSNNTLGDRVAILAYLDAIPDDAMTTPTPSGYWISECIKIAANAGNLDAAEKARADLAAAQEALKAAEEHEAETHRVLGAILGRDDSLEQCAKRLFDRAQRAEALAEQNAKDTKEAIAIAGLLFDAWEDGTPCFETDGESGMGASIGNAFKLSDEDFTRCTEFLNRVDPRGTAIAAGEGK